MRWRQILEAQATVERWLAFLTGLSNDDPRFDGAVVAYSRSIDLRRMAERSR